MIAQRGYGVSPLTLPQAVNPRQPKQLRTVKPAVPRSVQRRRLGFKEKHALKVLPDRIAKLEQELKTLGERLSDPALYGKDPETFNASVERHQAAQQELGPAEEEWLALEMLREEIEIQLAADQPPRS